jgi:hypothetical protein
MQSTAEHIGFEAVGSLSLEKRNPTAADAERDEAIEQVTMMR